MEQFVIPAILGLLSGIVGSLVAPWVSWGIEKRRLRLQARQEFVRSARELLEKPPVRERFRNGPLYSRLRPHLSATSIELIESESIIVQTGGRGEGPNNYVPHVLDDIKRLEEKWKLL